MLASRISSAYTFEYPDLPIPEPGTGQALLKNRYLGLCASDIQIYHGRHRYVAYPLVMGHEAVAEIVSVGPEVTAFSPGDLVVVQPQLACGECWPCRHGSFNVCENLRVAGVHTDGFACEYSVIDTWNLHPVPHGTRLDAAALAEPLAVGFGALRRAGGVSGKNVCVVGAGAIGNLTAQAAALGGANVIITDVVQRKLEVARACGIPHCENTREQSLKDAIIRTFGDYDRADVIIDCAATPFVFGSILDAARNASTVVITGNYKENVQFDVPLLQRREITLAGHMMYDRRDFENAVSSLASNKICTEGVISRVFPLSEYGGAFRYIDENASEVMKVLIEIS